MNGVFEIFTNIRCGWGSSLLRASVYSIFCIWSILNKGRSQPYLSQYLSAAPDVGINLYFFIKCAFSLCCSHLFSYSRTWGYWDLKCALKPQSLLPDPVQGEVLGHISRSAIKYLYDMCFLWKPCVLVCMQSPQGWPHWVKPRVSFRNILLSGNFLLLQEKKKSLTGGSVNILCNTTSPSSHSFAHIERRRVNLSASSLPTLHECDM